MASAPMSLVELENDPRLFLYTSLTAGSSHIITATSRMETILKANRIPFQAIDTATDEKARMLWRRRAGQRKLPGLVKDGFVIGDLMEVEEWNEFGELKENIGTVPASTAAPPGGQVGVNIAPPLSGHPTVTPGLARPAVPRADKAGQSTFDKSNAIPLPGAAEIAARNKKATSPSTLEAINPETLTSSPEDKTKSIGIVAAASATLPTSTDQHSTSTPQVPSATTTSAASEQHRGSDVLDVSKDEVKKIEQKAALKEEQEDDAATKGLAKLSVNEGKPTQEQDAKEPAAAGESVED